MVAAKRNGIKDTMRESLITTQIGSSDICQVCILLILHLMVRYTMDHVTKLIERPINDAFHFLQGGSSSTSNSKASTFSSFALALTNISTTSIFLRNTSAA